jgi:hypothetical protein
MYYCIVMANWMKDISSLLPSSSNTLLLLTSFQIPVRLKDEANESLSTNRNKWEVLKDDVDFISCRMPGISRSQITSAYHNTGASISATVTTVLQSEIQRDPKIGLLDDPVAELYFSEILQEFPTLPSPLVAALIQVTSPSTANAHELAKAITRTPETSGPLIDVIFKSAPISALLSENIAPPTTSPRANPISLSQAAALEAELSNARSTLFAQASAAARRGKSQPLMNGAAAYYASEAHALNTSTRRLRNQLADATVAENSAGRRYEIDLHHVSVPEAKRIAIERVTAWWAERNRAYGGDLARLEGGKGFTIITGKGTHSRDGAPRLGPSVAKALLREGYKIHVAEGSLVVVGVQGR